MYAVVPRVGESPIAADAAIVWGPPGGPCCVVAARNGPRFPFDNDV